MSRVHFLNVREGDCNIIEHNSGRISVIDICNGNDKNCFIESFVGSTLRRGGNYNQKNYPTNPINYLKNSLYVKEIFRYIQTHPDMDHMDGIKELFENFTVYNMWDIENVKSINKNDFGQYSIDDWLFYQKIRKSSYNPMVLNLYEGARGDFYSGEFGDNLTILSPSYEMLQSKIICGENNYNDCSYVILFKSNGKKIIFAGDSEETSWNYIMMHHQRELTNIDVLIAPHHGRKSGGNDTYLNVLNPKLTLFGNAKSQYLDYNSFNNRSLEHITNNQAGNIILDINDYGIDIYVQNENFAKTNGYGQYSYILDAFLLRRI